MEIDCVYEQKNEKIDGQMNENTKNLWSASPLI